MKTIQEILDDLYIYLIETPYVSGVGVSRDNYKIVWDDPDYIHNASYKASDDFGTINLITHDGNLKITIEKTP